MIRPDCLLRQQKTIVHFLSFVFHFVKSNTAVPKSEYVNLLQILSSLQ